MSRLSLGLIVRNEAHQLEACLSPLRTLVDEIVVVDTGSTDATIATAQRLGARVETFRWCDDFSAARNEMLRRVRGDWILWLDADDRIDAPNAIRLRDLVARLDETHKFFVMDVVCATDTATDSSLVLPQPRLFRTHPQARWTHRVHEQILPTLERLGYKAERTDIRIQHVGYQDAAAVQRKANRDLRLLRMDYAIDPEDPATLFHLGLAALRLGQAEEAARYLTQCVARIEIVEWQQTAYFHLVDALSRLGRRAEGLNWIDMGLQRFPDSRGLWTLRGELCCQMDRLAEAEPCFQRAMQAPRAPLISGEETLLNGVRARIDLGMLYIDQRRYAEAEGLLLALLAEGAQPVQVSVWLSHIYLANGQADRLEEVARQLDALPTGSIYADVLRAKLRIAQRRLPEARQLLDEVIRQAPQLVWARLVLSDWLVAAGAPATELLALHRDILRLQPGNAVSLQAVAALERHLAPTKDQRAAPSVAARPA